MLEFLMMGAYKPPGGGNGFALFGGGLTGSSGTNYMDKYTYASNAVIPGTALIVATDRLAATGNSTVGIFGGGNTNPNSYFSGPSVTTYTDKYTYADNTRAAGTVLGLARGYLAATGNSTVGIFGGGYSGANTAYTDKYTYSTNAVAAGTVLGLARYYLAATGNSTVGIFGGGYGTANTDYTDKYTYSNNTVAAGTVLGLARQYLAATGNSTVGIFGGGTANTTYADKYTYANDAVAAGTVLGLARQGLAAAGNSTVGIFGGGSNTSGEYSVRYTYTDKYTYANDAVAAGTVLGVARHALAATSSSPGGF